MTENASGLTRVPFHFASKATTLAQLTAAAKCSRFCDQIVVATDAWKRNPTEQVAAILARFGPRRLAVRSSATKEDGADESMAGAYLSQVDIPAEPEPLAHAVSAVFASYLSPAPGDQVLVQPMVEDTVISGVVLTRDLTTGSPYYVINYDDFSGRTDTVTGGAESKTILVHRSRIDALKSPRFAALIQSVQEIEGITGSHELDIEFCITRLNEIYILQVRPLAARRRWDVVADSEIDRELDLIRADVEAAMRPASGLGGNRTVFGEMPDWNPAEMIGNAPRPLAYSLYATLITDSVWSEARAAMGYRHVGQPLMRQFGGRPYIDVRKSLNSFLPAALHADTADRLVTHQLALLADQPELHDKIEFGIALTCQDLAFADDRKRLDGAGLSTDEFSAFEDALGVLTRDALGAREGEIVRLLALSRQLTKRRATFDTNNPFPQVHALIEDTRKLGTLPFSILARHGFIGVQFLRSIEKRGVFGEADITRFMRGIHTIASDLVQHIRMFQSGAMTREDLLARYGHLRPGTYDILSWRYDERPDLYLAHAGPAVDIETERFELSPRQCSETGALLAEAGYPLEALDLLDYIVQSVKAREEAKFCFTHAISDILAILAQWGEVHGLSRDDLSFVPIDLLLHHNHDLGAIRAAISREREIYRLTQAIRLPHLIQEASDIDVVRLPLGNPTFITNETVTAQGRCLEPGGKADIDGRILLIESADPGFDWIFSHPIEGLITKFGGANSHMAIRCAEFGLPAAIGCGERLFDQLATAPVIELNCAARTAKGVRH